MSSSFNLLLVQSAELWKNNKIFKSLFAIMVLVAGSFWACCVFGLLVQSVQNEFFQLYVYYTVTGAMAMCASTLNTPILLVFRSSSEHSFCLNKSFVSFANSVFYSSQKHKS